MGGVDGRGDRSDKRELSALRVKGKEREKRREKEIKGLWGEVESKRDINLCLPLPLVGMVRSGKSILPVIFRFVLYHASLAMPPP